MLLYKLYYLFNIGKYIKNLYLYIKQNKELGYLPYYKNVRLLRYSYIKIKGYNKIINDNESYLEYIQYILDNSIKGNIKNEKEIEKILENKQDLKDDINI